jgi:hypothetical protein
MPLLLQEYDKRGHLGKRSTGKMSDVSEYHTPKLEGRSPPHGAFCSQMEHEASRLRLMKSNKFTYFNCRQHYNFNDEHKVWNFLLHPYTCLLQVLFRSRAIVPASCLAVRPASASRAC